MKTKLLSFLIGTLLALHAGATSSFSNDNDSSVIIKEWLQTGPVSTPFPLFHKTKGKEYTLGDLMKADQINLGEWRPFQNVVVQWSKELETRWMPTRADSSGFIYLPADTSAFPQTWYIASYIQADRWQNPELGISATFLTEAFLDGESLGMSHKMRQDEESKNTIFNQTFSKKVKLETGRHLLIVKALILPKDTTRLLMRAMLKADTLIGKNSLIPNTSPVQSMNLSLLLDGPKTGNVSISTDGDLATVSISQVVSATGKKSSWLELWTLDKGRLVQTFRGGMDIGQVEWGPIGHIFAYKTTEEEKSSLWVVDLDKGTTKLLLKDIKDLESFSWSPDGQFIVYSIQEKTEESKTGLKRFEGMPDRWPWWRNRSFLYLVNYPEGTIRRLTDGKLTTTLNGISPDGKKLLFSRSIVDFSERPYEKNQLFILHLATMFVDTVWSGRWFDGAKWSPDGNKLILLGGPSMFGKKGWNVPEGMIPNESDTQIYLLDMETRQVDAITRDFAPSVSDVFMHYGRNNNNLYIKAVDKSYKHLYRYNLKSKQFILIDTGLEILDHFAIARDKPVAVYTGSSAARPPLAYKMDLKNERYQILTEPEEAQFKHVEFGKVERWTYKNTRGFEIEGRIYYPPQFDPSKKYPCIVYYYGGTTPVTREFGGRYPKNYWAANGYVVYVPQPSGAIGFGQEFSAFHVNDWGKIVAPEIIDGVRQFLIDHPFVDSTRVGAIGASYGGFMTMNLLTKTNMFRTAVSHAGISSISSYWGEGYWGYLYSATATANSFPWNRRDIYVDQSALFNADKINTPLLLLNGSADTNVPPGESTQLYTALKLLGKEVEYIQVSGQNHWIMDYQKRILWSKTIVAWFDRWLKDQPQWWYDMYPKEN